ncbi:MAG: biopolymer transporter ExbD [Duncaniella sp.]|uniref:ExbD/TolR family protein n=1 Tax=Duncaniella sp. TaxID=2518496 RepID=UPI0019887CED|nr:biopolymer transporter ExbD [Duncaniella sp.]MBD5313318.1 biopolymer transporter ExbD [Bacteroides sp.]MDE6090508.1 biopolymer transporter ExbD [Duncaniella sp.]
MALKRQNTMMAAFSMASMTDVIFLLLIFFMVTSTFVFPTALEVNLPQSSKQTALKPSTRVYIDKAGMIYATADESEPVAMDMAALLDFLGRQASQPEGADEYIAVYADEEVTYGTLVKVLDLGAQNNLKMVLATKPAPASARPAEDR